MKTKSNNKFNSALVKTFVTALVAAATTFGLAANASAQPKDILLSEFDSRTASEFESADTDQDGRLSPAEAAELPKGQRKGKHHHRGGHRSGQKRGQARHRMDPETRAAHEAKLFAKLDSDGNGELSASEWSAQNRRAAKEALHQERRFAHADTDNSGFIEREEFKQRRLERLRAADADGDGIVTREELKTLRKARRAQHQQSTS